MKNSFVFCVSETVNGHVVLDFYIIYKNEHIFLFRQKYRESSFKHYQNKSIFHDAIDYKRAHSDTAIENVIKRLRSFIPYLEKEYEMTLRKKAA